MNVIGSGKDTETTPLHAQALAGLATVAVSALAVKFEWCSKLCMLLMPYHSLKASEYVLVAVIVGLGVVGISAIRQRHLLRQLSEKNAEQRATHALARTDFLTGIPNRLALSEYVADLDEKVLRGVAALVLDLDDFKAINDTMGHAAGDEVLKCVASRLVALGDRYRDTIIFRLGGDEFLIMVQGSGIDLKLFESIIRETISVPMVLPCGSITVSSSIGAAPADIGNTHFANIMAAADLAMFGDKRTAKSRSNASAMARSATLLANSYAQS